MSTLPKQRRRKAALERLQDRMLANKMMHNKQPTNQQLEEEAVLKKRLGL